jgi:DNA-binding MarR family transcriptional regulator
MSRAPTSNHHIDPEREATHAGLDPLTVAKLWDNPCWLSFRLNFVAFRFNDPVYRWIETRYGLVRPEFVALYSVGLKEGVAAKNIVATSSSPKNTLSRAIQRLLQRQLLKREIDPDDRRSYVLHLTSAGRRILDEALPLMVGQETAMLACLSEDEQLQFSALMDKMIIASAGWPRKIELQPRKR